MRQMRKARQKRGEALQTQTKGQSMKAMILAAGMGSRLMPFTTHLPKALVPVNGRPMIAHLIDRLAAFGIHEFVVNLHHHGEALSAYLETNFSETFHFVFSDEEELLLDTGGALKRAAWAFDHDEPFLIHNVDVWTSLDPLRMLAQHHQSGALATLAVRHRESSRALLFDEALQLAGWRDLRSGDERWAALRRTEIIPLAFSGVQIVSPGLFSFFPAEEVFSLTTLYLRSAAAGQRIIGFIHDEDQWHDLGTPERILALERSVF